MTKPSAQAGAKRGRVTRLLTSTSGSRVIVMAIRVASMAVNFLVQIVMARVMGLAAFGSANTALALLNILVIPAAVGYDTAAIRYVALAAGNEHQLRALTVHIGRAIILASLLTAAVMAGAAAVADAVGNHELAVGLAFLVVILPGFAIVRVGEAGLRGFGSLIRAQINSNIVIPTLTIVVLVALRIAMGAHHKIGVAGALGARTAATVVSVAIVGGYVARRLGGHIAPRSQLERANTDKMRSAAYVLCGVAFLAAAVSQIDVVAVSLLRGASSAGIYSAASRVAFAMNVSIVAVSFVLAPHVARLFSAGDTAQLQREVSSAALWSLGLMLAFCAVLIPASPIVMRVFGSGFDVGANALRILLLGQLINGVCGPVAIVLNMTGNQGLAIRALGAAALTDIVLLAVLIPLFGIDGAACSTAVTTAIWNVAMVAYVRRDLGIWVLPSFVSRLIPRSAR
jgi:O-antigen/teichoic acid export membrane protein